MTKFAALAILVVLLAIACNYVDAGNMVFAGVDRSTAELTTLSQRAAFSESVVKAIANMMLATGGEPTDKELSDRAKDLGVVTTVEVNEVNDTFTNVQLECELSNTQLAILEQANVESWNALKSTGIVIASDKGPDAETQGARTVVFFAIVTIVAVVCAGLASWFVRRRAIEQHRGIYFPDLTTLEEELFAQQETEAPVVAAQRHKEAQQLSRAGSTAGSGSRPWDAAPFPRGGGGGSSSPSRNAPASNSGGYAGGRPSSGANGGSRSLR